MNKQMHLGLPFLKENIVIFGFEGGRINGGNKEAFISKKCQTNKRGVRIYQV